MKITSPAFESKGIIPQKYTCQGQDINPPLKIENVPDDAKSLALIVEDPDAPAGTWIHWIVYGIPIIDQIQENSVPGTQGRNDFDKLDYGGPCPPSGVHRYFFRIYALDKTLSLEEGIDKDALIKAMDEHILEQAELVGRFGNT
ncbi:MAG: YbhB/YbcL family Raf kinase inhibitor-like protein [bacterium]